jgi:hypothetical protein
MFYVYWLITLTEIVQCILQFQFVCQIHDYECMSCIIDIFLLCEEKDVCVFLFS